MPQFTFRFSWQPSLRLGFQLNLLVVVFGRRPGVHNSTSMKDIWNSGHEPWAPSERAEVATGAVRHSTTCCICQSGKQQGIRGHAVNCELLSDVQSTQMWSMWVLDKRTRTLAATRAFLELPDFVNTWERELTALHLPHLSLTGYAA